MLWGSSKPRRTGGYRWRLSERNQWHYCTKKKANIVRERRPSVMKNRAQTPRQPDRAPWWLYSVAFTLSLLTLAEHPRPQLAFQATRHKQSLQHLAFTIWCPFPVREALKQSRAAIFTRKKKKSKQKKKCKKKKAITYKCVAKKKKKKDEKSVCIRLET